MILVGHLELLEALSTLKAIPKNSLWPTTPNLLWQMTFKSLQRLKIVTFQAIKMHPKEKESCTGAFRQWEMGAAAFVCLLPAAAASSPPQSCAFQSTALARASEIIELHQLTKDRDLSPCVLCIVCNSFQSFPRDSLHSICPTASHHLSPVSILSRVADKLCLFAPHPWLVEIWNEFKLWICWKCERNIN